MFVSWSRYTNYVFILCKNKIQNQSCYLSSISLPSNLGPHMLYFPHTCVMVSHVKVGGIFPVTNCPHSLMMMFDSCLAMDSSPLISSGGEHSWRIGKEPKKWITPGISNKIPDDFQTIQMLTYLDPTSIFLVITPCSSQGLSVCSRIDRHATDLQVGSMERMECLKGHVLWLSRAGIVADAGDWCQSPDR